MASVVRENWVAAGGWRTVATLWNTTAVGVFRSPAGARIKVRYGWGWLGKDRQVQTLDGLTDKRLSVSRWSVLTGRMQVYVTTSTTVTWTYIVEGP